MSSCLNGGFKDVKKIVIVNARVAYPDNSVVVFGDLNISVLSGFRWAQNAF
jgi:hypothetical protein